MCKWNNEVMRIEWTLFTWPVGSDESFWSKVPELLFNNLTLFISLLNSTDHPTRSLSFNKTVFITPSRTNYYIYSFWPFLSLQLFFISFLRIYTFKYITRRSCLRLDYKRIAFHSNVDFFPNTTIVPYDILYIGFIYNIWTNAIGFSLTEHVKVREDV